VTNIAHIPGASSRGDACERHLPDFARGQPVAQALVRLRRRALPCRTLPCSLPVGRGAFRALGHEQVAACSTKPDRRPRPRARQSDEGSASGRRAQIGPVRRSGPPASPPPCISTLAPRPAPATLPVLKCGHPPPPPHIMPPGESQVGRLPCCTRRTARTDRKLIAPAVAATLTCTAARAWRQRKPAASRQRTESVLAAAAAIVGRSASWLRAKHSSS
jgi:hypothetical protein